MKLAIMQPYFFPYIGYFQLINAADVFVIYDNIQFSKKGWINRNRILVNGNDEYITLPLKKDSDYLDICKRQLADTWDTEKIKMLRKITGAYSKAPEFKNIFPLIEEILNYNNNNLFDFIFNSVKQVCSYINIQTSFVVSSEIPVNHLLKSQDKVLAICNQLGAAEYINPIGGTEMYSKNDFLNENINLSFLKAAETSYSQFKNQFVPWLSIIDVLMFNETDTVNKIINHNYTIV